MLKVSKLFLAMLPLVPAMSASANAPEKREQKPAVYLVADAHLDTQWNWDIQTTIKDYVWKTLDMNLKLLDKYPEYIFNFEGGVKYAWMKEYYPREYELMKKHIKSGRWHISGASWDATDALVPSVESAIRNVLLGQEFYRKEFGVESTDIFLPDCFGFGWTLPTIASHCGLIGFSSQKLGWRHNPFHGNMKYPFNVGLWKGVDGSEIMMAHGYSYTQRWKDVDLTEDSSLKKKAAENDLGVLFHYYGTGDTGGSPTISSVDAVCGAMNNNGALKIISATSDKLFKDFMPYSTHPELPVYDGELLMDVHGTGCYTSQAAMKLYNRQNEILGDAAERASVAAEMLGVSSYPGQALTESWKRFIFHQFHDDLTGTSIPRAYEFSWNDELLSLKQFSNILTHSVGAVSSMLDTRVKGIPVVFYNALGHDNTDVVELAVSSKKMPAKVAVYGPDGQEAKSQILAYSDGKVRILVEASAPANGFAVYDIRLSGASKENKALNATGTGNIENSVYKISLDANGDIKSLYDKKAGKELVKPGKAIRLALFPKNESTTWPAWEIIKRTVDSNPVSISENVKMSVVETGPLRTTLCVEKEYGDSKFRQYIRLYEGVLADRIDFFNEVDWATTNALVKAEFPLNIQNEKATYDLGLGTIERGNNKVNAYEVYAQRWADLTDKSGNYGVTIMNDCKYGWDKPDDSTLRLTLLHTPMTKSSYAYQDHQDIGHHTFTYSLSPHKGALDKADANRRADALNQGLKAISATKHNGSLGKSFSAAGTDNDGIAIRAFKKAESSDEYVVRVYDISGKGGSGKISFPTQIVSASQADGTEKTIGNAKYNGNTLDVNVGPNGMATYKVEFTPAEKSSVAEYEPIKLAFDKRCFSWDKFCNEADFEHGYSYAAELIPASLISSGVPFTLETKELLNGKKCAGDTITIPEGNFNRIYILAAAATDGARAEGTFRAGKSATTLSVPSYTGFIGQWGHTGHTEGYVLNEEVAFTGTHRHSEAGNHPYEFTYIFKYGIDIPAGTKEIILPDNEQIVIFAATAAKESSVEPEALSELYRTSILPADSKNADKEKGHGNILRADQITAWSGFVNDEEKPEFLVDGNPATKWCDVGSITPYVDFDLGTQTKINGWSIVNAGSESHSYITAACLIQGRNSSSEEWTTFDVLAGNKRNIANRKLKNPVDYRYLRLLVVQPEQSPNGGAARIYEFEVY